MTAVEPRLSILLLTEDSGKNTWEALQALLVRLLRRVVPGAVLEPGHWERPIDDVAAVMRGNGWKNPAHRELVRLRQFIAAKLREERGFVFFHHDGDRVYGERSTSENAAKFVSVIRDSVRMILEGPPPRRRERQRVLPSAGTEADALLVKLIPVVPFYCVEAWYFQNTARALALCQANVSCRGGCAGRIAGWEQDRGALDEVERPKERAKGLCFKSKENLSLAKDSFPIEAVLAAGKSLHDLKVALDVCEPLRDALVGMCPPWASEI